MYTIPNHGYVSKLGYPITCIQGKDFLTHRLEYEKHIDRKLKSSECVHHIDGNKLNNSIENLEITDRKKHPTKHRHNPKIHKFCRLCSSFLPTENFSKDKYNRFRSYCKKCRSKYQY